MRILTQRVRLLFLTVCFSSSWAVIPLNEAFAQNLPQSQQLPSDQATSSQPAVDTRGTDPQPFIVKTIEPYKSEAVRKQEEAERSKKAENEFAIVVLTGILAVVAIGQLCMFWRQLKIMESGVNDAKEVARAAQTSADAAKLSGNTLMSAQRAYMAVQQPEFKPTNQNEIAVQFMLANFGNTPARKVTQASRLHVREVRWSQDQGLPDQGEYRNIEATAFPHYPQITGEQIHVCEGTLEKIKTGSNFLYLIGTIQYEDIFGGKQFARFFFLLKLNLLENNGFSTFSEIMSTHNDAT
jgi:hypothetical protein